MPMYKQVYEMPFEDNGRMILSADLRRRTIGSERDRLSIEVSGENVSLTPPRTRRRWTPKIPATCTRPKSGAKYLFLHENPCETDCKFFEVDPGEERAKGPKGGT